MEEEQGEGGGGGGRRRRGQNNQSGCTHCFYCLPASPILTSCLSLLLYSKYSPSSRLSGKTDRLVMHSFV